MQKQLIKYQDVLSCDVQVVCLARIMVYFGFYNFSKLLCLARVLLDGLDVKSSAAGGPVGNLFGNFGKGSSFS